MNDAAMRRHIIQLVQQTVRQYGLPDRPKPEVVIRALRLPPATRAPLGVGQDGLRSGDQIVISTHLRCPERIEFTLFHEIVHILVERDGEIPSALHDHFYNSPERAEVWALEELCQLGAAEFVMPSARFTALMREHGWHLWALETAAETFGCSVVATAFQFAHHHPDPCVVLVCERGIPDRATSPSLDLNMPTSGECLHVAYTARNSRAYPMCRRVPVPPDHLIHRVWREGSPGDGEAPGFFRAVRAWRMACQVVRIQARAYAAFYPKGRTEKSHQPQLFAEDA